MKQANKRAKVKNSQRLILDAVLTALIILEMFFEVTGDLIHEIVGATLLVLIIANIALSFGWLKKTASSLGKKKVSARRKGLFAVVILLIVTLAAMAVSSLAISNILISVGFAFPIGTYYFWAVVHSVSAYMMCAIAVVHLAMHWSFIASVLGARYPDSGRRAIGAGVYTSAALGAGLLVLGAAGELPSPNAEVPVVSPTESLQLDASDMQSGQSDQDEPDGDVPSNGGEAATDPDEAVGELKQETRINRKFKRGHHRFEEPYADEDAGNRYGEEDSPSSSQEEPAETIQRDDSSYVPQESIGGSDDSWGADRYDAGEESEPSSSFPTGFCTLCRKGCALSAPQCDRPYEAGLISISSMENIDLD